LFTDGVRHLGEALATAQTDDVTVEALLGDDDESFLFTSLTEDPENEIDLGIRTESGYNPFDDWQMDVDTQLDDILSGIAVVPTPEELRIKVRKVFISSSST
jgi:hypothetical protein